MAFLWSETRDGVMPAYDRAAPGARGYKAGGEDQRRAGDGPTVRALAEEREARC